MQTSPAQVSVISESGQKIPAREFIKSIDSSLAEKLLKFIAKLETDRTLDGPLVSKEGPGRFKVSVANRENRLVEFILIEGEEKPEGPFPAFRDQIIFYPLGAREWDMPSHEIFHGWPGEEEFVIPPIVQKVLDEIRARIPSPYYRLRPDGVYEISIPEKKILGTAVWK